MYKIIVSVVLLLAPMVPSNVFAAEPVIQQVPQPVAIGPLVPLITPEPEVLAAVVPAQALPEPAPVPEPIAVVSTPVRASVQSWAGLMGTIGYANPNGNCVNEPGVNNPGWGNPIDWPVTSYTPWIGASALFTYNHVAVVTGIWSNGDIEVRHQNFQSGVHRFPASQMRGYR